MFYIRFSLLIYFVSTIGAVLSTSAAGARVRPRKYLMNGLSDSLLRVSTTCTLRCLSSTRNLSMTECVPWDTACVCESSAFNDNLVSCLAAKCYGPEVLKIATEAIKECKRSKVENSAYWVLSGEAQMQLYAAIYKREDDEIPDLQGRYLNSGPGRF